MSWLSGDLEDGRNPDIAMIIFNLVCLGFKNISNFLL